MTILQVRSVGSYGFDVTPMSGLGLSEADAATTRTRVTDAQGLSDAIRQALEAARNAGVQAFKPSDSELSLPAGMTATRRDFLFDNIIGRVFGGGPMSLQDWSRAAAELDRWAAGQASMLPPDAGGGSRYVKGTWYVNGVPWSLSELFTANRVNTLSEIDRMVADSLNVIAANNEKARGLTELMKKMFDQHTAMGMSDTKSKIDIEGIGQSITGYPIGFDQLLMYADKYIGAGSMVRKLQELAPFSAPTYVSGETYRLGDSVTYSGAGYQVTATNTHTAYSSGTQYKEGDLVYHLGILYALDKEQRRDGENYTQGIVPPNTDYWNPVDDYAIDQYYGLGEMVRYNGKYYKLMIEDNRTWPLANATRGKNPVDFPSYWSEYTDLGTAVLVDRLPTIGAYWKSVSARGLSREDFRSLIDEVETIVGAFGADNQVAQMRNETLFNSRSNLLEGLSTFLKGQQTTRSTVARNA